MISSTSVRDAVAKKVSDTFIKDHARPTVYTESMPQSHSRPCFFISQLSFRHKKVGKNRYELNYLFNIRYHTKKDELMLNEVMEDVGLKLTEALDVIDIEQYENVYIPCNGLNITYEIVDEVLQFFVNYELNARKEVLTPNYMDELIIKDLEE